MHYSVHGERFYFWKLLTQPQLGPSYFFCGIICQARVCWPLLCLCRPVCIFKRCLDLTPESCRSKQARYQLSHPSPYLATHLPTWPPIHTWMEISHVFFALNFRSVVIRIRPQLNHACMFGSGCGRIRTGSSISIESGSGYGSRVLMNKNWVKIHVQLKFFIIFSKFAI